MASALIKAGANINGTDTHGLTSLQQALSHGRLAVAKLLIEAGANVQRLDKDGNSLLYSLLDSSFSYFHSSHRSEIFTLLTDAGATVDGATAKISPLVPSDVIRAIVPEDTPFWLAANNDAPMLAFELAVGLNPNMKTENGMTLLHWACAGDASECVLLLLDAGADKEAGDPTPIFYCMHESSDCLKCMIAVSTYLNHACVVDGRNYFPINFAFAAKSQACMAALAKAGAWVTLEEMGRNSCISPFVAALNLRPVPIDALRALLVAAGERVLRDRIDRMPPLYWAVNYCTVEVVHTLMESGANLREKYMEYNNILEYAEDSVPRNRDSSNQSRLAAIIDYCKTLPCFSEEQ